MDRLESRYLVSESGFTLIELMISLVLGLLISAAVIQVYIINTRTITVQQSASEVQDSTIFSMQTLEEHVRLANLGNAVTNINSLSKNGGIVLTTNNIGNTSYANTGYLTVSAGQTGLTGTNGWTGISNMTTDSDQLTIQYKNTTGKSMYDCEGTEVVSGSSDWVIERYFVRLDANATTKTGVQDLVLACDAGRVTDAGVLSSFGDKGEVIIPAIDQFKVLLGAMTDISKITYMPAATYLTLTDKPSITTIKLGVVIRSSTPLLSSTDKDSFMLLDQTNTLKTDSSRRKFYRRAYESTVLLRNARVMSVTGIPAAS
ncbi:PilW family protein [Psychrobacter glacincola]|uniref:PilW family protein n=1 Tax=Psychrobacter glacincola TaxID=56810 RepID=UPI003BB68E55